MGVIIDSSIWVDVERGRLAADLDSSGKPSTHKVQDVWLAALAIQHNLSILTQNTKDFQDVPGLRLLKMPSPAA